MQEPGFSLDVRPLEFLNARDPNHCTGNARQRECVTNRIAVLFCR